MANKPVDSKIKTKNNSKGSPFLAALFKVLGTLIIVIVLVFSVPAAVPRLMGFDLYNIVSGSMEPTIPVNAAVYVQKVDPSKLETGNIIAFRMDEDVVVHRVTKNDTEAKELHTKGDANDTEDLWAIKYDECLGRVRVSVRMLGGILDFSTSSTGKFYIFFILLAGIIFSILGKALTPPDELYDYDGSEKKGKVKNTKSASKSTEAKTEEKPVSDNIYAPKVMSESVGIPKSSTVSTNSESKDASKTVTVTDAINNNVDESILDNEPSPAELEVDKPVSLADLAKDYKVDTLDKKDAKPDEAIDEPKSSDNPAKLDKKSAKKAKKAAKKSDSNKPQAKTEGEKPSDEQKAKAKAEQEKYKKLLNTIIVIIIVLVLALLGVAGSIFYINYRYSKQEEQANEQVEQFTKTPSDDEEIVVAEEVPKDTFVLHTTQKCPIDVDFDSLKETNPDVVGWIYCEDTVINYPILQGEDDEYYLHHDLNGKSSSAGCIFVDCNNMGDFSDVNSIIYGHHMKNGSMFACLQNWENQDFYDAHKYMWIITPEANYEVWIFSGYLTDAYSDSYLGIRNWGETAEEYIKTAQSFSDITPLVNFDTFKKCADDDQRYIMLSTCEYEFQNARYVIHGKLVKETPGIYGNEDLSAEADEDLSKDTSATSENTNSDTETKSEPEDYNFENLVEIKDITKTSSNYVEGQYSVLKIDSTKCDQTFLTNYYYNYVEKHPELLWNVIYYSDKTDYSGIYVSNGLIEKNVKLDAEGNLVDSENAIVYKGKGDNSLEECEEEFIP